MLCLYRSLSALVLYGSKLNRDAQTGLSACWVRPEGQPSVNTGVSLLPICDLPVKPEPLWPCKSHPGQPLVKAWQLIGWQVRGLSRHGLSVPLRFVRTSSSALLVNIEQQRCTGHVSPSEASGCDSDAMFLHKRTHGVWKTRKYLWLWLKAVSFSLRMRLPLRRSEVYSCFMDGETAWGLNRTGKKNVCRVWRTPTQILKRFC